MLNHKYFIQKNLVASYFVWWNKCTSSDRCTLSVLKLSKTGLECIFNCQQTKLRQWEYRFNFQNNTFL